MVWDVTEKIFAHQKKEGTTATKTATSFYAYTEDCQDLTGGNWWIECQPEFKVTITEKESDGFILPESAINAPGLNYFPPNKMEHTNHFQMRNNKETRLAIKKIFEQGLGRDFFKTDKR